MATKTHDLNPQISTLVVGTKELRTITVYPLSLADQVKMSDILSKVLKEVLAKLAFLGGEEEGAGFSPSEKLAGRISNFDMVEYFIALIKENLKTILDLVLSPEDSVSLADITNMQFTELATIIYEVNYELPAKNLMALGKRAKLVGSDQELHRIVEKGSRLKK
jgi:hypothetical protein